MSKTKNILYRFWFNVTDFVKDVAVPKLLEWGVVALCCLVYLVLIVLAGFLIGVIALYFMLMFIGALCIGLAVSFALIGSNVGLIQYPIAFSVLVILNYFDDLNTYLDKLENLAKWLYEARIDIFNFE